MEAELRYYPGGPVYPLSHTYFMRGEGNRMWSSNVTYIPGSYWTSSNVYFTTISYRFKGSSGSGISGEWIYQP